MSLINLQLLKLIEVVIVLVSIQVTHQVLVCPHGIIDLFLQVGLFGIHRLLNLGLLYPLSGLLYFVFNCLEFCDFNRMLFLDFPLGYILVVS
jgi:hypothetical protein